MNLIEDHQRLIQENQRLRVLLQYDEGHEANEDEPLAPSSGSDNLTRIYMEGFHICHPNFGQLRTDDSDNNGCLFCRALLQKTTSQKEQPQTSEDDNESKGSSI